MASSLKLGIVFLSLKSKNSCSFNELKYFINLSEYFSSIYTLVSSLLKRGSEKFKSFDLTDESTVSKLEKFIKKILKFVSILNFTSDFNLYRLNFFKISSESNLEHSSMKLLFHFVIKKSCINLPWGLRIEP